MKTKFLAGIGFVLLLTFGGIAKSQTKDATLTVIVEGIEKSQGNIFIALFDNADDYEAGSDAAVKAEKVEAKAPKTKIVFNNIPRGEYGIKLFVDKNNNGKLDTNIMGMPSEPYGFSNNASATFGAPDFEETLFVIDKDSVEIHINVDN